MTHSKLTSKFLPSKLVFNSSSNDSLTKLIQKGEYPTNTPEFTNLSENLIDLISGLLETDPEKRLTVAKILSHPWVVPNSPISPSKLNRIKKFAILEDEEYSSDEEPRTFGNVDKASYYIDEATFDKIN